MNKIFFIFICFYSITKANKTKINNPLIQQKNNNTKLQCNNIEKTINKEYLSKKKAKTIYKYDFSSNDTFNATALSLIPCLPFGQIYNGDYKTAILIEGVYIFIIGSFFYNCNKRKQSISNAKNEQEKRKIHDFYRDYRFYPIHGFFFLTWLISVCQAFISASMNPINIADSFLSNT